MSPRRQVITLSAIVSASGPLTLITEIAPVPGTVAGAHIVSSFLMYILFLCVEAAFFLFCFCDVLDSDFNIRQFLLQFFFGLQLFERTAIAKP